MRLESSFIQIHGIGEHTEQRLWQAGVTDWCELPQPESLGNRTRERVRDFAAEAIDRLDARDIGFFANQLPAGERWRLVDTFEDHWTALDIETTGLDMRRDVVTTVSVHDVHGTRTLVRGDDLTRDALVDLFDTTDGLVTYNGARFDIPFLERAFDVQIDVPHLDLLYPCRRLGWTGGLSAVEDRLGFTRELPDVDGLEAVRLWHRYEAGDDAALDRLIAYNQEDTAVLLPITRAMTRELDRRIFEPYVSSQG